MSLFSWFGKIFGSKEVQKKDIYSLSQNSIDLIIKYEIGNKDYYNKFLKRPTWPKAASGVTIGIGYDLGYNSKATVKKDWGKFISDSDMQRLLGVVGIKGNSAESYADKVKDIVISWDSAIKVFEETTLIKFIDYTLKAFPKSEELHPDAFGALVSIVFNRGASMKGSRREEMRRIRSLVPEKDYQGIADEIRSMKRLWANKGLEGLLKRREAEAKLVESCI